MEKLYKIGLEVEGGWDGQKGRKPFDIPIISDFSIDGRTLASDKPFIGIPHVGEVVSTPMDPALDEIERWIHKYWPKYTNITCGYHIHLSTKSVKDYCHLTTKTFLFGVVSELVRLAKVEKLPREHYIWARLEGRNPFTMLNFDASNQIRMKQKSVGDRTRYGMLNYAWNIHGTVEFRAFPTFETPEMAYKFTKCYLDYVSSFLETANRFTPAYVAVLEDSFGETRHRLITKEVK